MVEVDLVGAAKRNATVVRRTLAMSCGVVIAAKRLEIPNPYVIARTRFLVQITHKLLEIFKTERDGEEAAR